MAAWLHDARAAFTETNRERIEVNGIDMQVMMEWEARNWSWRIDDE